ncbi:MAG: hypothetical protein MZV63_49170 [Marinilabiliales bacterium]|nr:hypothetical protein [Marinilabiliales bacterium]
MKELNYNDRKAIHNLKYYTWVEQQGKDVEDLNQLWYDRDVWNTMFRQVDRWDELINEFNERTGPAALIFRKGHSIRRCL